METAAEKDFIHVEDVVEAFMLAANKEFECEAFNVGIGTAHAFSNVINLLSECLKRNVKPIYSLTHINYVYHTLADTKKAEKFKEWKPKSLETDIKT